MKQFFSWPAIRHCLEALIIFEAVSLFAYFYPTFGGFATIAGWLVILLLTIHRLEWGLYVLLADLLIDSKGYLLFLTVGHFKLSWRIGIWLIIMLVWFAKLLLAIGRRQAWPRQLWLRLRSSGWLVLLGMISFGVVSAILQGNQLGNLFFDANGWLFWLILLPILSVSNWSFNRLAAVVSAGLIWLMAKTSLLLYAFSHFSPALQTVIYRWVRDTQVGEITKMSAQFYRVFIQSQVYLLIFLAILAWQLAKHLPIAGWRRWLISRQSIWWLVGLSLSLLPIIVGFSRSYWFGLVVMSVFLLIMVWRRYRWTIVWRWLITLLIAGALSIATIFLLVRFPWPQPQLSFNAGDLLEERLGNLDSEAGASSRWALLPKMLQAIGQKPLFGYGFGATITYQSADPRVLSLNGGGSYTTYAFEWGWLEIIFKFGLLWAIWYFIWLGRLGWRAWHSGSFGEGLAIGLLVLLAVHFFSPYLNHPLGIGWLSGLLAWLAVHQKYGPLSDC